MFQSFVGELKTASGKRAFTFVPTRLTTKLDETILVSTGLPMVTGFPLQSCQFRRLWAKPFGPPTTCIVLVDFKNTVCQGCRDGPAQASRYSDIYWLEN